GPPHAGSLVRADQKGCRRAAWSIEGAPDETRDEPMTDASMPQGPAPAVTVVVPVRNEAGNVAPLIAEIADALAGRAFEIIYVNDGSSDATEKELIAEMRARPYLRQIKHERSCGQSSAVRSGVAAARAPIVVTLDGDGQNDPKFLGALVDAVAQGGAQVGLAAGQRVGRKASGVQRVPAR